MLDLKIEAESLACMISSEECRVSGIADIKPDYYSDHFHRRVFDVIKAMHEKEETVTMLSVHERLGDIAKGKGMSWIAVKDSFHSIPTFPYYCEQLAEMSKLRELERMAQATLNAVREKKSSLDIARSIEDVVYGLSATKEEAKIITPKEIGARMLDTLQKRMDKKSNGGIKSSFRRLNYMMNGGIIPGQLIALGAKTGRGKTAFAMNLSKDWSIIQKQPGLYINTEMQDEQIDCRFLTMLSDDVSVTHTKIANGLLNDKEFEVAYKAGEKLYNSQFYYVTIPELTINRLISTARKFKAQKDIKYIVVDYIGRMETSDPKVPEHVVLYNIAKKLKTLAQNLKITVLMLLQINDDDKVEGAKKIINEVDFFAYLRDEPYKLEIRKNRDGMLGEIGIDFIGEKLTFIEQQ